MDRNQASFSPAGGGGRRSEAEKACRMLGAGSVAVLAVLGSVLSGAALPAAALPGAALPSAGLPGAAMAAPTTAPSHAGSISSGSSSSGAAKGLQLVAQTSWVKPGQMFDLTLAVNSSVPQSQLGIALSVYGPPEGQSSFDSTLSGDTTSEPLVSDTETVPLSSLPTDRSGDVKVQAGISSGDSTAAPATFNLDLQCAPENCSGVYPLRVQLMNTATGSVVVDLVTHIVFVESKVASRLRVALTVPLGTEPSEPSKPSNAGAPGPPTSSGLSRLQTMVSGLTSSAAPLTIVAQPETLQALGSGPADARTVANGIVALSDEAAIDVLPSTYVWVDPKAMVDSGLSSELTAQTQRGSQVMAAAGVQTSGSTTVIQGALDQQTLQALSSNGTTQVVLSSDNVVPVSGRFAGPSVQAFDLSVGHGKTVEAAQTDPALESELADSQGASPALAAHQLLADLALVAFEEPEATWVRGVVLSPPLNWFPTPLFLSTLLSGLAAIPVLEPVTLSSFFGQVSRGNDGGNPENGDGWPLVRQLAHTSTQTSNGTSPRFPARAFSGARTRLYGLLSVVDSYGNLTPLGDQLLSVESVLLSRQQQVAIISAFDQTVASRADVVSFSAVHTFRLTSRTATIPITLVRQVPYPVTVVLDLSSDKLAFLHGTNPQKVRLTQHVQSFDVDVSARTSGDFPVVVSVKSPVGGLVIVSAKFTVRSLSTSLVAILLTIVAAVVLLIWWARTLVTGRRSRRARRSHGAHSAGRHEDATPAGAEAGASGAAP